MFPVQHGAQPISLGDMLYIVVESNAINILGQRKSLWYTIFPDFITINMTHSHSISWELSLTLAGETQTVKMGTRLKILPEYSEV